MSEPGQTPFRGTGRNPAGPQGTRMFSTADLRQYASEAEFVSDGPASSREPVLEAISPGLEKCRFSLHPGRQTIGRGSDNDIIVADSSVSASHSWITGRNCHYVIMNTLSTNGTYVNDRRIHAATLKHGDHIRLGQAEFLFLTREHGTSLLLVGLGALVWQLI
jgi:hypothetical protein